jgi:hypothetical protein
MKHLWTVTCERVLTDLQHDTISLVGIIEELVVHVPDDKREQKLRVPSRFAVASLWMADDGPNSGTVTIQSPTGQQLMEAKIGPLNFEGKRNARTIVRLDLLPVVGEGLYCVETRIDGAEEPCARVYYNVRFGPRPE